MGSRQRRREKLGTAIPGPEHKLLTQHFGIKTEDITPADVAGASAKLNGEPFDVNGTPVKIDLYGYMQRQGYDMGTVTAEHIAQAQIDHRFALWSTASFRQIVQTHGPSAEGTILGSIYRTMK